MTTMQMTRAVAESEGYRIIPAEYQCPGKKRPGGTQDFGGFADLIACRKETDEIPGDLLAIQHTEGMNNRGERIRKIKKLPRDYAWVWLATGLARIELWVWRELKDGWHLQRTEFTLRIGADAILKDKIVSDERYDY